MTKEQKIINELMMLVGYATGVIEGLTHYECETWMMMEKKAKSALDTLNKRSEEILTKLEESKNEKITNSNSINNQH